MLVTHSCKRTVVYTQALPELAKRFADPKAMEKLKAHKTTHIYFKDDEFVQLLKEIQADPKKLKDHLTEPRMMQCVVRVYTLVNRLSLER